MIRFSAILVAGAIAVLVAGVLATSLALVYLSIGVSVLASVLLAMGVILRRREIFGEAGAAAASGRSAGPVTPVTGTPVMVGGRARLPEPGARPAEAGGPPAEAGAGSGNGSSGPPAGRDVAAEIRWAWQEQEGFPEAGPARAPQGRNGPGRNGPGQDGPATGGPSRAGQVGGYSGSHSSGRGRPPTAPPGRRPPAAPPAGTAPRGAGEPAANGSAYGSTDPGPGTRPGQGTRPDQGTRHDQRVGTAPPGPSAGPPGPPGPLAEAGPPAWPDPDITGQEPTGAGRPSREPDGGWVFTPPTPPPDLPAPPAEDAPAPAAEGPDAPAPAAEGPDAGITQQEPAHDRWPSRETEDRAATPPTPPERPRSPAEPDHPPLPGDDFWDRVNEELVADAEREPDSPPRAASAGPPPPAAGGDLWSRPVDRRADEVAGDSGPGRSAASEQWSAWAPSVSRRPGSPSAGDEDEPRDRADDRAASQGAEAGTLGPLFAWRDAAADHASAAGKETADAEKEADVDAEEADEEEEAAPSPWSIPLTLVGDLSDLGEEDDGQPASAGAAEDHGTGKPLAAGETPAPERTGSDVWARPSWANAEEKQAGPAETAFAGRGPWLTRPGKDTTADRDPGDAAATRAGDAAATRADDKADTDDAATAGKTARWAGALPSRVGRDEAATRAGGEAGADDHAKVTPADRDDATIRAGRDEAATRAGGEAGADDHAKATPTGRDAGAAASTSVASAGSALGSASTSAEAGQRAPGEARPPSATPAGRPSATLFQPTIRATLGGPPDPVTAKTAWPGTQQEAPSAAGGAGGQRAPEAGSGTGAGQTGPAPAAARDDDQRSATGQSGAERSGPAPAPDGNAFVIVPGVARYHRTGCILIRFLGGDDLETVTAQEAEAKGCSPCRACEPDKPLSSGD